MIVENGFKQASANGVAAQISNCILRIYTAAYGQLLSSHAASSVTAQADRTLDIVFSDTILGGGITNATAAIARIYASDGTTLLLSDLTADIAANNPDIPFDEVTPWNTGDYIIPGTCTIDMNALTMV